MAIKEVLGPRWAYIQRVPEKDTIKYCLDLLPSRYMRDERNSKAMIREAIRQLEKFFGGGPLKDLDGNYPVEKADIAVVDEEIPVEE